MPRIHQLPTSVITKISAGEVIERPASVVKELLENSVDAGSRRIDIDVDAGGADAIRVVDDGCGMEPIDLALAFASHATSKLQNADDLFRINTLGFRGEALASISGVAQVTLQSRAVGQSVGAELTCHGGDLSAIRTWNGSPGTRIEVRHLFFNTPVRRKFLRTTSTEMGHICETFTRLAISRPTLHLTLRHNGKLVYEVSAGADLPQRLRLFFGSDVSDQLYAVDVKQGPARLWGYITDPACERGNAKMQYLFVNGRWIRDRSLGHALQEAYRGLLMTGRYAVAFLFLELPPDHVDVNVHPTKAEVRFRDSQALYSMFLSVIRQRLSAENLTAKLQVSSTLATPEVKFASPEPPSMFNAGPTVAAPLPPPPIFALPTSTPPATPTVPPLPQTPTDLASAFHQTPPTAAPAEPLTPVKPLSDLKAIQLYNAYLVVETAEGMLVIDQHALHERILFEQLKRRISNGTLELQQLLFPEPVELTAEQAARTLEQREALAELGLLVEDFGGGTVLVSGYPAILGNRSPQTILKAVVDHLCAKDKVPTRQQLLNDLLSLMACHSAVRAGDPLTADEMAALLAQRHLADDTHHCPHGRPTALLFSRNDLDRQFRRI